MLIELILLFAFAAAIGVAVVKVIELIFGTVAILAIFLFFSVTEV